MSSTSREDRRMTARHGALPVSDRRQPKAGMKIIVDTVSTITDDHLMDRHGFPSSRWPHNPHLAPWYYGISI
jgi:hypothetical protein